MDRPNGILVPTPLHRTGSGLRAGFASAPYRILRYTAAELREDCKILEISTRPWVPTTLTRLAELKGMGSRGSRVFHMSLGEGQVVDMYDNNFGLKGLEILSLLHTVSP